MQDSFLVLIITSSLVYSTNDNSVSTDTNNIFFHIKELEKYTAFAKSIIKPMVQFSFHAVLHYICSWE